ncbi:MAG TPA: Lsr2 family protein, partial [Thermobifida alba]|nr:Lsr2 family protein [Thermobifida alba]
MARKARVLLIDDLDGGEAGQTVSFNLDGRAYEIDLSDANAARLRKALAPFITA